MTTGSASPSFPNVQLLTGRSDWRVWSTDTDNTGGYGDIGVISCPVSQNFAVKIANPSDGSGARPVKGITLVPTNSSNHSTIVEGSNISGNLEDDLIVQRSSGGDGGVASILLGGSSKTADITVPRVNSIMGAATFSGITTVGEILDSGFFSIGVLAGDMAVEESSGLVHLIYLSGNLTISQFNNGAQFWMYNDMSEGATATLGRPIEWLEADLLQGPRR